MTAPDSPFATDLDALRQQKAAIAAEHGDWSNHNLRLADGLYTVAPEPTPSEPKLRRMTQIVADWTGGQIGNLRVLDLACLEGLYGLELALHGARVTGIEGREANLAKARFAKEALGIEAIEFVQDDVRNLSRDCYGSFDVVLCLGILYHLDAPDAFAFLERVAEVCTGLAIVDTHVSDIDDLHYRYKDLDLWGKRYQEHDPDTPAEERRKVLWSSLDNARSFWLTRASLFNLLQASGFTSIYECHVPLVQKYEDLRRAKLRDRATFVAVKGQRVRLRASDLSNDRPPEPWPE